MTNDKPGDGTGNAAAVGAALRRGAWVPAERERALAGEYFARRDALDERERRPAMPYCVPPGGEPWPHGWPVHSAVYLADLAHVADDLAALAAAVDLAGSPVVSVLAEIAATAHQADSLARRILDTWDTDPPPPGPTAASDTPYDRYDADRTTVARARDWQDAVMPETDQAAVDTLLHQVAGAASTLAAIATGNTGL